ncbi:unnamed protein product, partial [marine sediment metagenome]
RIDLMSMRATSLSPEKRDALEEEERRLRAMRTELSEAIAAALGQYLVP